MTASDRPASSSPRPFPAGRGVYGISVVAELTGIGVQTLRLYERKGLIEPSRTEGGTRRYSDDDVAAVRRIGELADAGLNLAGIAMVLELEREVVRLRAELADAGRRTDGHEREWAQDVAGRVGSLARRERHGRDGRRSS